MRLAGKFLKGALLNRIKVSKTLPRQKHLRLSQFRRTVSILGDWGAFSCHPYAGALDAILAKRLRGNIIRSARSKMTTERSGLIINNGVGNKWVKRVILERLVSS